MALEHKGTGLEGLEHPLRLVKHLVTVLEALGIMLLVAREGARDPVGEFTCRRGA